MGDASTHVIFYSAYWYLVYEEDGDWLCANNGHQVVCQVGREQKKLELSEIK